MKPSQGPRPSGRKEGARKVELRVSEVQGATRNAAKPSAAKLKPRVPGKPRRPLSLSLYISLSLYLYLSPPIYIYLSIIYLY